MRGNVAKDKMGWHKIKVFEKRCMDKTSVRHLSFFEKRVDKGLDYKGRTFDAYTQSYKEY